MKRAYGAYPFAKRKILEILENTPEIEKFSNLQKNITEKGKSMGLNSSQILDEISLAYNAGVLELDAAFGRCTHFFFTGEGMHEWLLNCAAPLTEEQSKIISQSEEFKGRASKAFMLHFVGGNSPVYLCRWIFAGINIQTNQTIMRTNLFVLRGRNKSIISLSPGEDTDDSEMKICQSVLSSAFAYMQCFPDTVKDGIPKDLTNINHYGKTPCKSIGMHHSLVQHDGPCPHYRVGHFRFLSSEKFVHKKGQTIFIHGCFVKGQALTVLGIDETGGKHE